MMLVAELPRALTPMTMDKANITIKRMTLKIVWVTSHHFCWNQRVALKEDEQTMRKKAFLYFFQLPVNYRWGSTIYRGNQVNSPARHTFRKQTAMKCIAFFLKPFENVFALQNYEGALKKQYLTIMGEVCREENWRIWFDRGGYGEKTHSVVRSSVVLDLYLLLWFDALGLSAVRFLWLIDQQLVLSDESRSEPNDHSTGRVVLPIRTYHSRNKQL